MSTSVQTKAKINELKSKAFIPAKLPDDFLRVSLNQQQITENQDSLLAHRLQYGHRHGNRQQQQQQLLQPQRVPPRGRLNITIMEARLQKNYSLLTKMDSYVKILLGGKVFETETDYGSGKNPKWNKTIACYLPQNVDSFSLQIFDEKSFSTDEEIAVLNYSFPDELFQGVPIDEWLPLSGRLGEQKEGNIHLRLEFISLEKLQQMQQMQHQQMMQMSQQQQQQQQLLFQQRQQQHQQQIAGGVANVADDSQDDDVTGLEYTDADIIALKEMFPTFDEDVIRSILEANSGNKESTINQLLQMS